MEVFLKVLVYLTAIILLILSFCIPLIGPFVWGQILADMFLGRADEEVKAGFTILLTAAHSVVLWEIVHVFI